MATSYPLSHESQAKGVSICGYWQEKIRKLKAGVGWWLEREVSNNCTLLGGWEQAFTH